SQTSQSPHTSSGSGSQGGSLDPSILQALMAGSGGSGNQGGSPALGSQGGGWDSMPSALMIGRGGPGSTGPWGGGSFADIGGPGRGFGRFGHHRFGGLGGLLGGGSLSESGTL